MCSTITEQCIDGSGFLTLDKNDLDEIRINLIGRRKKILNYITAILSNAASSSQTVTVDSITLCSVEDLMDSSKITYVVEESLTTASNPTETIEANSSAAVPATSSNKDTVCF